MAIKILNFQLFGYQNPGSGFTWNAGSGTESGSAISGEGWQHRPHRRAASRERVNQVSLLLSSPAWAHGHTQSYSESGMAIGSAHAQVTKLQCTSEKFNWALCALWQHMPWCRVRFCVLSTSEQSIKTGFYTLSFQRSLILNPSRIWSWKAKKSHLWHVRYSIMTGSFLRQIVVNYEECLSKIFRISR